MQRLLDEGPISLTEAAKAVPPRRGGRPTHSSTLFRWATRGLRGVRLEVVQIGGTKCTTIPALARFYENLTVAAGGERGSLEARGV